jgi:lipopolysaccharide transport system permease protein
VETIIERQSGWQLVNVRELYRYRDLLVQLARRDIAVRYKQTLLGVAWVVLQPLAMMAAFSFFLARVGDISERVANYPLFVLTGLIAWGCFSTIISSSGLSMLGNQALVTKVYFPRLIIPISSAGVSLIDLAVGLVVTGVVMAFTGIGPGWNILMIPVITALLVIAALGYGIFLSALSVAYRDFRHVLPFTVQFWMFFTPVIYMPPLALGATARTFLPLNPAHGLILNFRQCLIGGELDWYSLSISSAVALISFVFGCLYFRRFERSFADVI